MYYNKIKLLLFFFAIPLGAFLFIYGEIDDSPGGQLIGVVIGVLGVFLLVSKRKSELR